MKSRLKTWVTWCFVNIVLKSKEKYKLIFWSQGHFNKLAERTHKFGFLTRLSSEHNGLIKAFWTRPDANAELDAPPPLIPMSVHRAIGERVASIYLYSTIKSK